MPIHGCLFPSVPIFFGPQDNNRAQFLEQAFLLQYHLGMSYSDVRGLPIPYRVWFIERLTEEFERRNNASKMSQSSPNTTVREVPMGEIGTKMGPKHFK